MEWEEKIKNEVGSGNTQKEIYQLCLNAFNEGCKVERELAIEAYRLRCRNLFGNKCLSKTGDDPESRAICKGKCSYMRQYVFELYKLEN